MKNSNTKIILIVVVIALVLVGLVFTSNNGATDDSDTIKIGVVGPMTGVLSRFGEWTERGALIAADEINANGGIDGKQIELIIEDDECNGVNASNVVNKLQDVDDVNLIVSFCTITSSAIAPITKDKSVVFAPTFKLTQLIEKDYPHYIAMQPSMMFEVTELFKHVVSEGYKSIGIIYTTNDFWTAYKDAVVVLAGQHGITVTTIEEADFFTNDFRTQLTKIKSTEPGVIFGGLNPGPLGNMMRQVDELNIESPVVGIWGTQAPDLIETGGDSADGIVYTYYYEDGFTDRNKKYIEEYKNRYNEEAELISASTYDIFFIIKQTVEKCSQKNLECIIGETNSIKDYEGASGRITFSNGTTIKDVFLKTVEAGKFIILE